METSESAADAFVEAMPADGHEAWLRDGLVALEGRHLSPERLYRVFERVVARQAVDDYWTLTHMAKVAAGLGRHDAAFLLAARAFNQHPEWDGSDWSARYLCEYLLRIGRRADAARVFLRFGEMFPGKVIWFPVDQLQGEAGIPLAAALPRRQADGSRPDRRIDREVAAASCRPAVELPAYGEPCLDAFRALARPEPRQPIDVAHLTNASVLIDNDSVAVIAADGSIQHDLSFNGFPELVVRRHQRLAEAGQAVPVIRKEAAVLIGDRFPAPNLCHFLYDHLARLSLYRLANVAVSQVTVVGPALTTSYQNALVHLFGVRDYLATGTTVRLDVADLHVSTDCRQLQHGANLAAAWAVDGLRAQLGGARLTGDRRLFVSRRAAPSRRLVEDALLETALQARGFETIVPENLTYGEQLAAFREASHVVGVHGAALTHLVLCAPGTRVLEIHHPLYGTPPFAMMAAAIGLDYATLAGRDGHSPDASWNDPAQHVPGNCGLRDISVDVGTVLSWLDGVP